MAGSLPWVITTIRGRHSLTLGKSDIFNAICLTSSVCWMDNNMNNGVKSCTEHRWASLLTSVGSYYQSHVSKNLKASWDVLFPGKVEALISVKKIHVRKKAKKIFHKEEGNKNVMHAPAKKTLCKQWWRGGDLVQVVKPLPSHYHFSNGPSLLMLIHVNKIHGNVAIRNKKHFLKLLRMLSLCFFFAVFFCILEYLFGLTKIQSFLLSVSSEEVLGGNQSCFMRRNLETPC